MSQRYHWLSSLLVLCLPLLAWSVPFTVTVAPEALVHGSEITIGDVAKVQGADDETRATVQRIVIGQSPLAGEDRLLYSAYIATRLKQYGFTGQSFQLEAPDRIRVIRVAQRFDARQLEAMVRQALKRQMPWKAGNVEVRDLHGLDSTVLPEGTVEAEVSFPDHNDFLGRTPFTLELRVDGNLEKKLYGSASIAVTQDVVTAVRSLDRHEVITAADVRVQRLSLTRMPREMITRVEDAIGTQVRRPLRANAVIQERDIASLPLVQKGDVVLVVAESELVKVTTLGEALESGRRGDTIRIRNTASKREIRALVVGKKTVRISL